jgi:CubicO group peptidase (beta-lactamase class C family)
MTSYSKSMPILSRFFMRLMILTSILGLAATAIPLTGDEITPAHFAAAAQYSESHGGVALRVEQGGSVIYESYAPGFSASTPHKIYSGTKSFVAVGALIAAQEGLLTLDEKADDTLTEWRGDRRRAITLNQLLSHTSGLDPDGDLIYPYRDQLAAAVHVPLIDPPGSRFHYGAVGYQAFGEILRRKLQPEDRSVEGWLHDKLFDPLDIDIANWKHDDAGNPLLHSGLSLSAKEWAKFGEFINRSRAGASNQVIINQSLTSLFLSSSANPAYGIGFWLNRPPPKPLLQPITDLQLAIDGDQLYPGGPRDLVAAIGSEKQRLYMIPSLDLVVVRFGRETAFSDGDFLSRLLTGRPHPDAHTH